MLNVQSASVTKPTPKPTILDLPLNRKDFPPDFFFGTGSSAYQVMFHGHHVTNVKLSFKTYSLPPAPYCGCLFCFLSMKVQLLKMAKQQATQNGKIGIVLVHYWMVPYSNSPADISAAERATDFMLGWFLEPINTGEYPQSMQDLVGPRLPRFYKEQSEMLKGSYDFLGLNYYTANYAKDASLSDGGFPPKNPSYDTDSRVIQTRISDDSKLPIEEALKDEERKASLRDHLKYLVAAMKAGVDVKGFFVWTLLDDFEWDVGFTVRFGMNYVDFNNGLKRYPKESALWFKNFLKAD
ncbi:hypothetical protein NE237_027386 [Protea cynaroides]|uniref:Beta-glucosidase n=1 Tax=Protea cynaroides TaxID=273540 RepID=A0A9Q0JRV4_9MAGN|nr:hypothetical protein NE237_027386 [Protea cynaroides]